MAKTLEKGGSQNHCCLLFLHLQKKKTEKKNKKKDKTWLRLGGELLM